MNDQVNKADGGKSNPLLLEQDLAYALHMVNRVLDYGAEKYERAGWKTVEPERYDQAARRHKLSRDCGELFDMESGLLHLAHEATNILFQLQMYIEKSTATLERLGTYNKPPQDHKGEPVEEEDKEYANELDRHGYTEAHPPPANSRHWNDLEAMPVSAGDAWVKLRHCKIDYGDHVVKATWIPNTNSWISPDPTVDLCVWPPVAWMEIAT